MQLSNIDKTTIPKFANLKEFVEWYLQQNMPIFLPENFEVFISDDATSSCLFRSGQYQAEMYLIHPNAAIPLHDHPGVENFELTHKAWNLLKQDFNDLFYSLLQTDQNQNPHGFDIRQRTANTGLLLISLQKWDDDLEVSTIATRWRGATAGPKHDALIQRFNPECLSYPGYADVTKKREKLTAIL
jgi:hypothetical protein